jgi:uncharacterized membrane protein YciS (DUF1049 family)
MRARTVFILVLLMLFVSAIAQNTNVIRFRIWFKDLVVSPAVLLAVCLGVGIIIGFLLGRPWRRKERAARPAKAAAGEARRDPE